MRVAIVEGRQYGKAAAIHDFGTINSRQIFANPRKAGALYQDIGTGCAGAFRRQEGGFQYDFFHFYLLFANRLVSFAGFEYIIQI